MCTWMCMWMCMRRCKCTCCIEVYVFVELQQSVMSNFVSAIRRRMTKRAGAVASLLTLHPQNLNSTHRLKLPASLSVQELKVHHWVLERSKLSRPKKRRKKQNRERHDKLLCIVLNAKQYDETRGCVLRGLTRRVHYRRSSQPPSWAANEVHCSHVLSAGSLCAAQQLVLALLGTLEGMLGLPWQKVEGTITPKAAFLVVSGKFE